MAFDIFLKLDTITGDSVDAKHKDWITVESFSWGLHNEGASGAGGGGTGTAIAEQFSIVSKVQSSSPQLFSAVATGKHMKSAIVEVIKPGRETAQAFFKWVLEDVLVTSYQTSASAGGAALTDQFTLTFRRITESFTAQRPGGALGTPVTATFDFFKNTA